MKDINRSRIAWSTIALMTSGLVLMAFGQALSVEVVFYVGASQIVLALLVTLFVMIPNP